MKPTSPLPDSSGSLERLLNAAAAAPPELPAEAPHGLATRVLRRAWRMRAPDESVALRAVLRWAMGGACVVAILAVTFGHADLDPGHSEEAVFIESQVVFDDSP